MKNKLVAFENKLAHRMARYTAKRQGIKIGSEAYQRRLYGAKCDIANIEKAIIVYGIATFLGILPYALAMGITTARLRRYAHAFLAGLFT